MFILRQFDYGYASLEPYIDEGTMRLHHDMHHRVYVNKLNDALKDLPDLANLPILELIQSLDKVPQELRTKVRNNGGGHANHSMFWKILRSFSNNPQDLKPTEELLKAIDKSFSSFEKFQEKFSDAAANHFGSGWAWLVVKGNELEVMSTPNQDTPLMDGIKAILCLDVWEHSYYLQYQNRRADYIKAWWNVVNWKQVGEYFKNTAE